MERLHPGARWQFRVGGYFLFGILGLFLGVPISIFLIALAGNSSGVVLALVLLAILVYLLFVIIASEIYTRMSYNRWFYEFNEDGLRLERGIIWKRYSNVPYERIQNVDVHRGILARMLGFSSLMIQTAGYSAQPYAEGYIPAVEVNKAEEIRSWVMKKITRRK